MFHCLECLNNDPDFKTQIDEFGDEHDVCQCGAENSLVFITAQDANETDTDGPDAA